MNKGNYENFLIREMNGDYQRGDTNCSDCGQLICACESLSTWLRETAGNTGEDVRVPASPVPLLLRYPVWDMTFSEYGKANGRELPQ